MSMQYKIITNPAELRLAVAELASKQAIGLDTETTELDPYYGRLRLIQLATPDGVFIVHDDEFWLANDGGLNRWTPAGYTDRIDQFDGPAAVLTPRATVEAIRAGYRPLVHLYALPERVSGNSRKLEFRALCAAPCHRHANQQIGLGTYGRKQ